MNDSFSRTPLKLSAIRPTADTLWITNSHQQFVIFKYLIIADQPTSEILNEFRLHMNFHFHWALDIPWKQLKPLKVVNSIYDLLRAAY
ncbi:hypothetical protein BC2230_40292 [Burkholderia cepacia]